MEGDTFEKQMFSTNRRGTFHPIQIASSTSAKCPTSSSKTRSVPVASHRSQIQFFTLPKERTHAGTLHQYTGYHPAQPKKNDHLSLPFASSAYKELAKKYQTLKEEANAEKERRLQVPFS
jgi:hypothetical protein